MFLNKNKGTIGIGAFDTSKAEYAGSAFDAEYEKIGNYYVPWKFIPLGKSDKIKAKITSGTVDDTKKLKFFTPTGTEFFSEYKDGEYFIEAIGAKERDGIELYAIYMPDDTTKISAGKLKIASYPRLERKLVLVPMDKSLTDIKITAEKLNEIYKPYYIDWQVRIDSAFTDATWDSGEDGLQTSGSGFFSEFTEEMRALNAAYTEQRGIDGESLYLFVFPGGNSEGNLLGDMPLESRFGYIFKASSEEQQKLNRTTAHELGHGGFQLKHTFSDKYSIPKDSTNNLMDYTDGIELVKYQWDAIHDPQNKLFEWMQGESEGQMANLNSIFNYFTLRRNDSITASILSNKGIRKPCSVDIRFLNNLRDFDVYKDFKFRFRDTLCNANQGIFNSNYSVNVYLNKSKLFQDFAIDTSMIRKTIPFLKRGINPIMIELLQKTKNPKNPNKFNWVSIDTMNINLVLLKPDYYLYIKENQKTKILPFADPTEYKLTTDSIATLSIYDKQNNKDSILIEKTRWIVNRNGKQLLDTICSKIKISSNGIGNINLQAIYTHKNLTDTVKIVLTAPENKPSINLPLAYKIRPGRAIDRMFDTTNINKSFCAIKNDVTHTLEICFDRVNIADDFTQLLPIIADSVRLSLTVITQSASSIKVRVQPIYDGALLVDSTYIKLLNKSDSICRASQVVYILKPFNLELNSYNAPGMRANYDAGANQILEYIYGSVTTIGTQPIIANPDKNNNHFIDRIYGDPIKDEYTFLENHPRNEKKTNIYFINGVIHELWKINNLPDRRNVTLFDLKNLPDSSFQCEILDTAFNVLQSNLSATKTALGVSFPVNVTNNTRNKAAYLCKIPGDLGIKYRDNAVIVGTTDIENTLVHELLHILKLFDINVLGNMMHYARTTTTLSPPYFSNQLVPECETGTGHLKNGGGVQRQWLEVNRN